MKPALRAAVYRSFPIAAVLLLAACAGQETKDAPKAAVEDRTPTAAPTAPQATTAPAQASPVAQTPLSNPLKDPANILSKRSIYYDLDSHAIKDEYQPLLQAHAKYLLENKNSKIIIQGNCDERGSREYNLALGQRRADGVRRALMVLGVTENQIEAVSFGEEKPKAEGHDEAAWAQNRRSDIVYAGE